MDENKNTTNISECENPEMSGSADEKPVLLDINGNPLPKAYQTTPEEDRAKNIKLLKIVSVILIIVLMGGTLIYNSPAMEKARYDMVRPFLAEDFGLESTEAFDFTVYDRDGNEVHLSDFEGKVVVMNFWASWCPPCKFELGAFERSFTEYGDDVQFMMINVTDGARETKESCLEYVDNIGYTFPVFLDTETSAMSKYGTGSLPATFFISPDGHIAAYSIGMLEKPAIEYGIQLAGGQI